MRIYFDSVSVFSWFELRLPSNGRSHGCLFLLLAEILSGYSKVLQRHNSVHDFRDLPLACWFSVNKGDPDAFQSLFVLQSRSSRMYGNEGIESLCRSKGIWEQ